MATRQILRLPRLPDVPEDPAKIPHWIAQVLLPAIDHALEEHLHVFPAVGQGEVRGKEYTEATKPAAASAGTGAVIISTDAATKPQMSDGSSWLGLGAGGGGGDNIQVNAVAVTDANFNDSTPAAPADGLNARWQRSGASPDSVSANLPVSPNGATRAVGTTRVLTAGGGLFGGGDLSADRTISASFARSFLLMGA